MNKFNAADSVHRFVFCVVLSSRPASVYVVFSTPAVRHDDAAGCSRRERSFLNVMCPKVDWCGVLYALATKCRALPSSEMWLLKR
jgi:hypothetical protein